MKHKKINTIQPHKEKVIGKTKVIITTSYSPNAKEDVKTKILRLLVNEAKTL